MYFNPDVTYDKAIESEDKGVLRALLTGIIGSDPTFITTEFDEAVKYIQDNSRELTGREIELEEEYIKQEDEYKIDDSSRWDEHYFQMQLVWLRDNFSLKRRLSHIREVGKYVYHNKVTLGKSKVQNRKKGTQESTIQKESIHEKKASVVKIAGGDYEDKRLFGLFVDWAKDHWYIILIILVIVVFVLSYKAFSKGVS